MDSRWEGRQTLGGVDAQVLWTQQASEGSESLCFVEMHQVIVCPEQRTGIERVESRCGRSAGIDCG